MKILIRCSVLALRLFRWLLLAWLVVVIVALVWTAYAAPEGADGDEFWRVRGTPIPERLPVSMGRAR